jgi:hypothetical protein
MHDFAGYESRSVLPRQVGTFALSVLALAALPIAPPAHAADLPGYGAPRHGATKYTYPPQPRYAESYIPADQYAYVPPPGYIADAPVDSRPVHRTVLREYRVVVVRDPPIPTKTFPHVGYGAPAYGQVVDPIQAVVETRRYAQPVLRYEARAADSGPTVLRSRY